MKIKILLPFLLLLCPLFSARAFRGSVPSSGQSYYLFNVYQNKFVAEDGKLNNASAARFEVDGTAVSIGGVKYTLSKNASGYYQLKSGSRYFAFEEKVADANFPGDDNRCKYLGGGVTCQLTTVNSDRSYWMFVSEDEYAEWTAKKKFTVASLNVDGMPKSIKVAGIYEVKLNEDAKEGPGATAIGQRLLTSGYDVVGVSEDFNYHSQLWEAAWNGGVGIHYNATTHRGSISAGAGAIADYLAKRPVLDSDGLCLFYRIDGEKVIANPSGEAWTKWNDHYGYTDNGGDGLINKGFRYYVITLEDGTELDLYTMHMDAESSAEDNAARASQLTQLANHIKQTKNGRPILIIGDTNCRYTRDKLKQNLIDAINADERFTIRDPWIQFGRDNVYPIYGSSSIMASTNGYLKGEVVDKIFYINNKESKIRVTAETYCQDLSFVNEAGEPLCDHKPCVVTFSYHDYDPAIDDDNDVEAEEPVVYLRNRNTGRFLMNGGQWGSHVVTGNYAKPMYLRALPNGKYDLLSQYGHLTDAGYMDNNTEGEYISEWNIVEQDGFKILSYSQNGTTKALTGNDGATYNNNPLVRGAGTVAMSKTDKYQQWEILTAEQMAEEVKAASVSNPVNVTHLVAAANFDRIDEARFGEWVFRKNSNDYVTDNGVHGADNNPKCNFNRSITTKTYGMISQDNTWDLYQQLKVPAGNYVVSCQGFVQEAEQNSTNVKFYAWSNPEGSYVEVSQDLASYMSEDATKRPATGDQTSAATAFNNNLYNNVLPVVKVGEDGVLVIGVKKNVKTKSNATWTCVDNFQLHYLGTGEAPETVSYNVAEEARKAEFNDDNSVLTLKGAWRIPNMTALKSTLGTNNVALIDAKQAVLIGRPELPVPSTTAHGSMNTLIKVSEADKVANTKNVVVDGRCANLTLNDYYPYMPGMSVVADKVVYSRTANTTADEARAYNAVCLPFAVQGNTFAEGSRVFTFKEIEGENVVFEEIADYEAVISAGTPLLVETNTRSWKLQVQGDVEVLSYVPGNSKDTEQEGVNGSFVERLLGDGCFVLSDTNNMFAASTASTLVSPFRFYLNAPALSGVQELGISTGEETSIQDVLSATTSTVQSTYDLNGRRIVKISRPGVFVKDGRKVVVK